MKKLLTIIALLATAAPAFAQVTFGKWQDMGAYIGRQTEKLNTHTDEIAALKAENATLKSDLSLVIGRYDTLLRYLVIQACLNNEKIAVINTVFDWVKPFPLGNHECPPPGTRFYIPGYLSPTGPMIPPDPTDTFDRADGAAGADWSAGNIVGGKMRVLGTSLWTKALGPDQYIRARMTASSTTQWAYHGLVLRAGTGTKVQYRFTVSPNEGKYGLEYMNAAGEHTSILSGPITYTPGAEIGLRVKGTKLSIYYAGKFLGEADDSRITAGSVGLIGLAPTGQYAEFDDVYLGTE